MKTAILLLLCFSLLSCRREAEPTAPAPQPITSDQQLFTLITRDQPFARYGLFPNADSVVSGTLNGSSAHQPEVRVLMNSTAIRALPGGLPQEGLSFPDGSVILKEVRTGGVASLYAVLYKEVDNPLAGGGWLWAEFRPDGAVVFSIERRGAGCISCHSREDGPRYDHVRTFERQNP
ncbi:MAG: hypothetical protein H6Q30_1089 [Bacteroidetes bacterium]|nr:hypothetical protein [Bacteroidota bacterium]